jgi:protein-tyrosine phosphatase
VIDLHTHILPGLDDGARSVEESIAMARAAVADGTRVAAATPHVRDDYPTSPARMEQLVAELRTALLRAEIPLELRTGGELALERLPMVDEDELHRFGLGGNPRYLLLEFPYHGWPLDLGNLIFTLRMRGYTPVLAHPERNVEVQAAPERLRRAVEQGALVQLTAGSLDGRLGGASRRAATKLLRLGLAHIVASDAHAPDVRAIGLTEAVKALGDRSLAEWLTEDVPAAIVAGRTLPERPKEKRRLLRLPGRKLD